MMFSADVVKRNKIDVFTVMYQYNEMKDLLYRNKPKLDPLGTFRHQNQIYLKSVQYTILSQAHFLH